MSIETLMKEVMEGTPYLPEADLTVTVSELTEQEHAEVLAFLAERPLHTVVIAGFIRDNGFRSEHNRGTFYGCRNSEGRLEGVALVGHATLVESRTRRATQELALAAQVCPRTHVILGEREEVERFWNHYADEGQEMRRACRELLFEARRSVEVPGGEVIELRLATLEDLDLVAPVHAQMAEEESGVNPLEKDPEGFRRRCARRIEMGRVWVVVDDGHLLFKADVQADTPDVIYLEGVWVHPSERGTGFGRKCMSRLTRELLARTGSVCVLANEVNERAHAFFRFCNFKLRGHYDTIFLQQ